MSSFVSALAQVYKAIRAKLVGSGAAVGGTANYPRIEIHSVVEDAPATKDNSLRSITANIECISDEKVADIVSLADTCIEQIFDEAGLPMDKWSLVGVVPGQIRMLDEESSQDSSMVFYRLLQDITVWVERKKEEVSEADTSENEVEQV